MILGNLLHARLRLLLGAQGLARARTTCALDPDEPANVARMAARDEPALRGDHQREPRRPRRRRLGATSPRPCARCAQALPEARVEVLTPDFCGDPDAVARVLDAGPHVFNHNMETVRAALPRACARRPSTSSRSTCSAFAARSTGRDVLTKSGFMVGLGETRRAKCTRCCAICAAPAWTSSPSASTCSPRGATCRWPRTSSPAQFDAWRDYGLSLGFKMVFSGPLVRSSYMADAREPSQARRTALESGSWRSSPALLLILAFPRFEPVLAGAGGARAAAGRRGARAPPRRRFLLGWTAGIVYWFGVCYWIQFVLACHGGVGEAGGWALFMLFCADQGRCTWRVFALLAGVLMRGWWAVPAVAALWVAVEWSHDSLGFAWLALGNAGIDMSVPLRLAPFTGVYGISFVFAMMNVGAGAGRPAAAAPRAGLAGGAAVRSSCCRACRTPERGREAAVLVQPNISEDRRLDAAQSVERMQRGPGRALAAQAPCRGQPPAAFHHRRGRKCPPRSTTTRTRASARRWTNWRARPNAYVLLGVVAHTPDGAPLNSAVLVSPAGRAVTPLRQDEPGALRRVRAVAVRRRHAEDLDRSRRLRPRQARWSSPRRRATNRAPSSATNRCSRTSCGASRPDGAEVLFNLSNDGYFGESAARAAAPGYRAHARGGEPPLDSARHQRRHHRDHRPRRPRSGQAAALRRSGDPAPGFNYITAQTLYTRYGDWFPICARCAAGLLGLALATRTAPAKPSPS